MEQPILIQGAMEVETNFLIDNLENKKSITHSGYQFYQGMIHNHRTVISLTKVGTVNAAVATIIGINEFHPKYIINQGIAGGHPLNVHRGDLVLGENVENASSFITGEFQENEGIHPKMWELKKWRT